MNIRPKAQFFLCEITGPFVTSQFATAWFPTIACRRSGEVEISEQTIADFITSLQKGLMQVCAPKLHFR